MAVVSDLEGTLTKAAMWKAFGEYLKQYRSAAAYNLFFYSRVPVIALAQMRLIETQNFKNQWIVDLLKLFKGADQAEVDQMAEWVVNHHLWPNRREDVIAELEQHRDAGRRVIIASGVYEPIAQVFAQRIGIEALGSPLEYSDGRLTGRLTRAVSVQQEKVQRIREALNGDTIEAAYGDTESDVPMLALAGEAVAVYPDTGLRKVAEERGWRILNGHK